jgi:hypothetical protein
MLMGKIDGTEAENDMLLTFCADLSICCNYPNPECCADHGGVWIQDGMIVTTSPALALPPLSTSPPPSSTTGPTSTPTPTPPSNSYILALEISLPVLFSILLFTLCLYLYRRAAKPSLSPSPGPPQGQSQPQGEIDGMHEMDSAPLGGELENTRETEARATARKGWGMLRLFH